MQNVREETAQEPILLWARDRQKLCSWRPGIPQSDCLLSPQPPTPPSFHSLDLGFSFLLLKYMEESKDHHNASHQEEKLSPLLLPGLHSWWGPWATALCNHLLYPTVPMVLLGERVLLVGRVRSTAAGKAAQLPGKEQISGLAVCIRCKRWLVDPENQTGKIWDW